MPQCEQCGKRIPPRAAQRLREISGGPLLCRACMMRGAREGEPVLVCKDCGEPIEPAILRRILRARRRGIRLPRLCRKCFLKRRETIVDEPHGEYSDKMKVGEWECTNCGAALEPEEISEIRQGRVVKCEYCGRSVSREMFTA
jgi:DNA-directed RNA polymerase subunit RPC12/RpoP